MTDQHEASASVQPPPAVPAQAATAGAMLRRLRESAGVDAAVLAGAMKVSLPKLQALEADRLDQLPDLTFARGLASSICRAFGVDPAPVLERMPTVVRGLPDARPSLNAPFRQGDENRSTPLAGGLSRPLLAVVAVLLLAAALIWLWPTLPIRLGQPEPATVPAGEELPAEAVPPQGVSESSPPAVAEPDARVPAAAPVSALPEQPAVVAPAPGAGGAIASGSTPAPASVAPIPKGDLVFTATGESWVSVRDAEGKSLLNRALQSGETVSVSGLAPLSVTVGRKDAVSVQVRGEPFDLGPTGQSNVARFQVK